LLLFCLIILCYNSATRWTVEIIWFNYICHSFFSFSIRYGWPVLLWFCDVGLGVLFWLWKYVTL
jgi:hypothetical protein